MLAEEFGYQISSQSAEIITPDIRPLVDEALKTATNRQAERQLIGSTLCLFIVIISAGISGGLNAANRDSVLSGILVGGIIGLIASWLLIYTEVTKSSNSEVRELQALKTSALSGPWQAWPCRLEAIKGVQLRRLLLIGPDGSVASEFHSSVPEEVWTGMIDGRGLVWFVGDMRFGGVMSLPGGSPIWLARLPKKSSGPSEPTPSSSMHRTVEEELTRKAIDFAFDRWLK